MTRFRSRLSAACLALFLVTVPLSAQSPQVSAPLTSATCPGTGCVTLNVQGLGSAAFQLTGTFSATVTFEASLDGRTYTTLNVTPVTGTPTAVTTATTPGIWGTSTAGLAFVRARVSSYSSGTVMVTIMAAPAGSSLSAASGGGGGGTPGGAVGSVQYNNSGAFGGFGTWNGTTFVAPGLGVQSAASAGGTYTLAQSGIVFANADGDEIFRVRGGDVDDANFASANLYVGQLAGAAQPSDNVTAGYANTGLGAFALQDVVTGNSNVAVGTYTLRRLAGDDANENVAIGYSAMQDSVGAAFNVVIGASAAFGLEGEENVVIGQSAMQNAGAADLNVAIGLYGLFNLTTGTNNIGVGPGSLSALIDGEQNVMVGGITDISGSGYPGIVHGDNNTILGFNAGPATDLTNAIALGFNTTPTASNTAIIGNADVTDVYMGSVSAVSVLHAATFQPTTGYKSSDGSTGFTGAVCTAFKNGLCVTGS